MTGVGSKIWDKICDLLEVKYKDDMDDMEYEMLEDFLAITSEHNEILESKMLELVEKGGTTLTIKDIINF